MFPRWPSVKKSGRLATGRRAESAKERMTVRYSKNEIALLSVSLLGLAVALLSGAGEHVLWLHSWCASFSDGCRVTTKFTLLQVPVWGWGAGFFAALALSVLFASQWLALLVPVGIGVEIALVAIMAQIGVVCVFCIANAAVVALLALLAWRRLAFWQALALALLGLFASAVLIGQENRVLPWFCPGAPAGVHAAPAPKPLAAEISQGVSQILGPDTAPVTVYEYSDFRCPACRKEHAVVNEAVKLYGPKVRWVFKNFPLPMHKDAQIAAEGALCAGAQNKFWEYQDALFTFPEEFTPESLEGVAGKLGLDQAAFRQCLDSHATQKQVNDEVMEGVRAGINAVPSFVINGKVSSGTMPLKDLRALIDEALKAKGAKPGGK